MGMRRSAVEARVRVLRFGCCLVRVAGDCEVLQWSEKLVRMYLIREFAMADLHRQRMYEWLALLEEWGLVEKVARARYKLHKEKIFAEFVKAEAAWKKKQSREEKKSGEVARSLVDDEFGDFLLDGLKEEVAKEEVSWRGERCSNGDHFRISGRSRIQNRPCRRKATGLFNGRPFCGRHNPSVVKKEEVSRF